MISCLGKFDQNQSMCTKEISAFQKCYKDFKDTYEAQKTSRYTQTELAILVILMDLSIVQG